MPVYFPGNGLPAGLKLGSASLLAKQTPGDGLAITNLRRPTLVVEEWYGGQANGHNLVHIDEAAALAYWIDDDRALRKSTGLVGKLDEIASSVSTRKSVVTTAKSWAPVGDFWRLPGGTLLLGERDVGQGITTNTILKRSTDDGTTWTTVMTLPTAEGATFLGPMSIGRDEVTGYLYAVEYYPSNSSGTTARIYRSTDDGVTWIIWFSYPMALSGANNIRHWHSCRWDPIGLRMYFFAGDQNDDAGLWRVSADGSTAEKVITNSMMASQTTGTPYPARLVDACFFPNYIAWGNDGGGGTTQFVWRVSRSSIAAGAPVIEKVGSINGTCWWSQRAAADGSAWVIGVSNESFAGRIDSCAHIYALWDDASACAEVGAIAAKDGASISSLGGGAGGGDSFYMRLHNCPTWPFTTYSGAQFRARLAWGVVPMQIPQRYKERMYGRISNAFSRDLAANETRVVGHLLTPRRARKLCIEDIGLHVFAGTGACKISVYSVTQSVDLISFASASSKSWRSASEEGASDYWFSKITSMNNGDLIEIRLIETAGATCSVSGFITTAWTFGGRGYEST